MIDHLHSMMDNLSDVYYLMQLIIRQIIVYLRDLIHYKFFWLAVTNNDFDAPDTKIRSITSRNITADIMAFAILCTVLFLLVMLTSKCEKDRQQRYASIDTETVSGDLQEDPYCISNASSSSTTCFHACGDSHWTRGRIIKRNFSDEDVSRVRSSNRNPTGILKKSIFGLNVNQLQTSQSTQTRENIFHRTTEKWLIRKTRSGQIYGKYPV
ncbi:uncharacterized protein LOC143183318 [Calliopsis andreniformis]|uniref:uncharacterized protein LOC143183318 n=1 Tax=Calliopsis andreniformis TaxID=337506 RepID=UPI003FCDFD75